MKKILALFAFIAFISVKSATAQTEAPVEAQKPSTEMQSEATEAKEPSCHTKSASASKASCCKNKSKAEASNHRKASCCVKGEHKAEMKEEKVKGEKTL